MHGYRICLISSPPIWSPAARDGPGPPMEAAFAFAVGDVVAVVADEEQLRGLVTGHPSLCWSTACEKLLGSQGSLETSLVVIHVLLIVFSHLAMGQF